MSLTARVAYLRGLADGAGLTQDEKQGTFVVELLDVLEDISFGLEFLEEDHDELEDYLEDVDYDLSDLESFVYDDFDDEFDVDEFFYDEDLYTIDTECPDCGQTVHYYDDEYDESVDIICPYCEGTVTTIEAMDFDDDEGFEEE